MGVHKFGALLAVGVLLSLGCSSDDDDAGPSAEPDTEGTGTSNPGAEPAEVIDDREFTVMVIGDETSTISFAVPEAVPAVQGALTGLPNVEVLSCDSAGDANAAEDCQRQAVDAGVDIVIVSFGRVGQDAATLTASGIPMLGGGPANAASSFSTSSGLGAYAALGAAAGEAGCQQVATLYLDGAEFLADMVRTGVELQGAEEVARSGIPQNTPDIAPQVAALTGSDADCIVLSVTPTQVVQAMTALDQSGSDAQLIAADAVFPQDVIDELGDLAEGVIVSSVSLNANDDDPAVERARADLASVDPDASLTTVGLLSWASAQLILDALPQIDGEVTAESLTEGLRSLDDAPAGGVLHPVYLTTGIDNPLFANFYNPWALLYRVTDGRAERISEDWFSLEPVLSAARMG